jgi:septum formation protein
MATKLPPVILASASPRRSELLRTLVMDFKVVPSDAEEAHNENLTATEVSQLNAYRKARVVAKKFPDALVLGADTLVYLDTTLFGKPSDSEDAFRMLNQLQNKTHQVVTGVCLLHLRGHRQTIFAESTDVKFLPLTGDQIQEFGNQIVERISGSLSNVIGLPVERLSQEFASWQTA